MARAVAAKKSTVKTTTSTAATTDSVDLHLIQSEIDSMKESLWANGTVSAPLHAKVNAALT
jgi:hypothetical protein